MKKSLIRLFLPLILSLSVVLVSCKKYLDAKPDQKLMVPSTLKDLEALIDQVGANNIAPSAAATASDEYFLLEDGWSSLDLFNRETHIWYSQAQAKEDWRVLYFGIFQANVILDNLQSIEKNDSKRWDNVKGMALFFRSYQFFQLAQLFAEQYDSTSASNVAGIPLRLTSNFNTPTTRSTLQETYSQIINDLLEAESLVNATVLPQTKVTKCRPGRPAVYGLLSRVYLQTGDYAKAKEYADKCLAMYDVLQDYNELPNNSAPFKRFNEEVIFYTTNSNTVEVWNWVAKVDSSLFNSYEDADLRKFLFFETNSDGTHYFKGSYNEVSWELFGGIATDEIYVIKAESAARTGDVQAALNAINALLIKRYDNSQPFTPVTASSADEALDKILLERRKELINRGLRWYDLRRLNKESRFQTTLKRVINTETYTLPPNDPRYTFLVPQDVINLSGIEQNKR